MQTFLLTRKPDRWPWTTSGFSPMALAYSAAIPLLHPRALRIRVTRVAESGWCIEGGTKSSTSLLLLEVNESLALKRGQVKLLKVEVNALCFVFFRKLELDGD